MNVSFTGHRVLPDYVWQNSPMPKLLVKLYQKGALDFYAGGALRFDMLCETAVLELRDSFADVKLHMLLPCSVDEQTAKWSIEERRKYHQILQRADSIEFCSDYYSRDCMKIRNAKLVELADVCVCYYNSSQYASGTGQTVRMAQKKGIKIINIATLFENSNPL